MSRVERAGRTPLETKALAITTALLSGSTTVGGKVAGVEPSAISRWIADSPERVEQIRLEMQKLLLPGIMDAAKGYLSKLIQAAGEDGIEIKSAKDARDAATAFGILLDKARIVLGIPERVEHFGTIQHNVRDLRALERDLRERERLLREEFGDVVDVEVKPIPE
jgi:hypothetical protein